MFSLKWFIWLSYEDALHIDGLDKVAKQGALVS